MKKINIFLAVILCLTLLTACGTTEKVYTAEDVEGKIYTYEKDGFGGPFTISIYEDGTFSYYVGFLSSYIGFGRWSVEDGVLTLKDSTGLDYVNRFRIGEDMLTFVAEGSTGTMYLDMEDGDRFFGELIPTLPTLEEVKELVLKENVTEEELKSLLQGFTSGEMIMEWGTPDGMCSGLWCNFWELDEDTFLAVYYQGSEGSVQDVFIKTKE